MSGAVTTAVSKGTSTTNLWFGVEEGVTAVPTNSIAATGAGTARTSASFAALTTPLSTTLTINTLVCVTITGTLSMSSALGTGYLGFAMSGANTVAASTVNALEITGSGPFSYSIVIPYGGLTPGSTTFALQYAGDGTNGLTVSNARIVVLALN